MQKFSLEKTINGARTSGQLGARTPGQLSGVAWGSAKGALTVKSQSAPVVEPGSCSDGFASPALRQAVGPAVHLKNVDMVGEPVEQRAGEAFSAKRGGPFADYAFARAA